MDSTITNIAAPTIVRDIGGGESLIKWLGASYALAMGVLLVVGGRLGDRYGRRRMFLIGISGFTLASLACGLARRPGHADHRQARAGRLRRAAHPAGHRHPHRGLLPRADSRAFSRVRLGAGRLRPSSARSSAGFIISANIAGLTWRPVFLINIVLGTAGLVAAVQAAARDQDRGVHVPIDGLGAGLLGAAMLGLIYGLIDGSTDGWTAVPIVGLIAGAALSRRVRHAPAAWPWTR